MRIWVWLRCVSTCVDMTFDKTFNVSAFEHDLFSLIESDNISKHVIMAGHIAQRQNSKNG